MQPAGPYNGGMFFFTYLAWELRRRLRQAVFIALGLAVGVGLVVTVTAASAGVKNAQAGVLKGLYGVGTDIIVTGPAPSAGQAKPGSGSGSRVSITMGPNGAQMCVNGKCRSLKDGYTIDTLASSSYAPMNEKAATEIAALPRRGRGRRRPAAHRQQNDDLPEPVAAHVVLGGRHRHQPAEAGPAE